MNKELKAFRKICKNLNSYEFTDEYKQNKELIESALEELDFYVRHCRDLEKLLVKVNTEREKYRRAIRVIKRNLKLNAQREDMYVEYSMCLTNNDKGKEYILIDKKEYDLLNEVSKNE